MIQGVLLVPEEYIFKSQDKLQLLAKLWVHEAYRVFSDRLVSLEDRELFEKECLMHSSFKAECEPIFCNFVDASS